MYRPGRSPRLVVTLLLLAVPLAAADAPTPPKAPGEAAPDVPGAATPGRLPTIAVGEIVAGQKGYGLSVFQGSEPERFDVEVIGVVENMRPDTSYILARLSGHDLDRSGVVAGMSGSPVFLDGRLAGAVAFSWPFSNDAIAGITPIGAMRQLSGVLHPPPTAAQATTRWTDVLPMLAGPRPEGWLESQLAVLRPRIGTELASGVQWSMSGAGSLTQSTLARALGGLAVSGSTTRAGELKPGGSVAAVLVDGDFRLAATGTVTDMSDGEVLAFGHPFLGLGPIAVPMATSDVITIISSQANSFKLANVGPVVGAFQEDRMAGIRGRIGATARTIPVRVTVTGAAAREYNMQVADIPEYLPALFAVATLASLDAASYAAGVQELDMDVRFDLGADHGKVALSQTFDGPAAAADAASYLIALGGFLVQNRLASVDIAGVEVELRQAGAMQAATIVGAHAERSRVHPGDRVGVTVDLVPFRGKPLRRELTVEIPADLPEGRYSLLVGDGASIDGARFQIEPADPVSFDQVLGLLRSLHSRRTLVVLGVHADAGLAVAGEVMPRLPGSIRSLWKAAGSRSATPLQLAIADLQVDTMPLPADGAVRIDLQVERPQPTSGESADAAAEEPSAVEDPS